MMLEPPKTNATNIEHFTGRTMAENVIAKGEAIATAALGIV
jgi:hypothetical protein